MKNRCLLFRQLVLRLVVTGVLLSLMLLPAVVRFAAAAESSDVPLDEPKYQALLKELSQKYDFEPAALKDLFKRVSFQRDIIQKFERPAEHLPFYRYRKIFIKPDMIERGQQFVEENRMLLEKVERTYGVEKEIIAAILGIETRFGKPGIERYRAFDILNTAYALYPRREAFYRGEIIAFLRLCREEKLDPFSIKSSYAGAFGVPQFIPSSFRKYSVDFDGDGKRDLWKSKGDIFASVANYLKIFGWKFGGLSYLPARIAKDSPEVKRIVRQSFRKTLPVARAMKLGIEIPPPAKGDEAVSFALYEPKKGEEALLALFGNFRALTRYNTSVHYALTVVHLSRALAMKGMD